jgi:hypothetical protein
MAVKKQLPELSASQSIKKMKELFKGKKKLVLKDFTPGRMLTFFYNAKDKTQTFDKTPLVFVLRRNKTHTLGINMHWSPYPLRQTLIKKILTSGKNRSNIKKGLPIVFSYKDLKPFLKRIGFAPIIRLYINNRISSSGVVIPDDEMMTATRIKSETFTQGRVSAEKLYKKAIQGNKKYRKNRKRRE